MDDVLLVSNVCGGQMSASVANSAFFTSSRSDAASITRSAAASALMSVTGVSRARM
ncbi:Uncharacterised protein [Enterobacter cancerogenus]|uniref:Uncharacterized protein n=1 Tax=Enterobacter cancerogenus TaxID=69218 RepID=A0A484Z6F9_9ENTR|nr:Uncharacterised protein [Enterobacter cancerogenus]